MVRFAQLLKNAVWVRFSWDRQKCVILQFRPAVTIGPNVIVFSLRIEDFQPNPLIWFFNTGLGGSDSTNKHDWRIRTFPKLLKENNHTEVSTVRILSFCKRAFLFTIKMTLAYQNERGFVTRRDVTAARVQCTLRAIEESVTCLGRDDN